MSAESIKLRLTFVKIGANATELNSEVQSATDKIKNLGEQACNVANTLAAELAEENYDTLQRMRGIVPTNKKVGRVEARPFMSTGLDKARQAIRKAWEGSLR